MAALPDDVRVYSRTAEFDEHTIPPGLLREHTTKPGVWGRIVVREGLLEYRVPSRAIHEVLDASNPGIVEPGVPHEVAPRGPVRFWVEFLKTSSTPS